MTTIYINPQSQYLVILRLTLLCQTSLGWLSHMRFSNVTCRKKKIPTWIIVCSRDLFGLFAVCRWKVEGGGRRSGSGWWTPSPLCRPGEGESHWSQIIKMWPTAFTYGLFRSEGTDPSAQNNETSASRPQHTACWFHACHFWGSILQKIGLTCADFTGIS